MHYDTLTDAILMGTNLGTLLWKNDALEPLPLDRYNRGFMVVTEVENHSFWGMTAQAIAPFPYGNAQEELPVLITPNRFIADANLDDKGRLWITAGDSILRFEDGKLTSLDLGLPSDQPWVFWGISQTRSGQLLIGAGNPGLLVVDGEDWTVIGEKEGLPSNLTKSAYEVENGDWWVVQKTGLVRMRKEKGDWEIKPLGREQGLLTPGIEGGLYDGRYIWLSDPKGLLRIDLDRVELDFPEAPLYLTRFEVHDSTLVDLPALLQRDENSVTFHFQLVDFRQQKSIRYQYRLLGLEDAWVDTKTNQVRFPQLGPGAYTFEVRASKVNGTWGQRISKSFTIRPAYYETWWFTCLLIMLLILLMWLIFALFLRRMRKSNAMREANLLYEQQALNAQMNPHFVFNSLNSIQAFIVRNDSRNSVRYLSKFAKLMRNSLDASQARSISLAAEIELLQNYCELEKLRFGGGFTFSIEHAPALNPDEIGLPTYLIQPHVENAIWHGLQHLPEEKAGHLSIAFTLVNGLLVCRVEDNGIGRGASERMKPKGKEHQSHALNILTKRLALLKRIHAKSTFSFEIIDLQDEEGHACGTAVELYISVMPLPKTIDYESDA